MVFSLAACSSKDAASSDSTEEQEKWLELGGTEDIGNLTAHTTGSLTAQAWVFDALPEMWRPSVIQLAQAKGVVTCTDVVQVCFWTSKAILSFLFPVSLQINSKPAKECTTPAKHGALYPRRIDLPNPLPLQI